jgi:hypothetical protein
MAQRKIADYELCDLGIENSQYFQGFGTSFTGYSECAYGIGDNPAEALDDCLEQIAQMGFDAEALSARIEADWGPAPFVPSVSDMREQERGECEDDDCEGCDACEESDEPDDCYYHMGIRWNAESDE